MKKLLTLLATVAFAGIASASLKPGDSLTPYEIQNCDTGKKYCQVCAYSDKAAKIIAFGKLDDAKFWADLKQLQTLHAGYEAKGLGVFAQVIDSTDTKAIAKLATLPRLRLVVDKCLSDKQLKFMRPGKEPQEQLFEPPCRSPRAWTRGWCRYKLQGINAALHESAAF